MDKIKIGIEFKYFLFYISVNTQETTGLSCPVHTTSIIF